MFMKRQILLISMICIFFTCGCDKNLKSLSTDTVDKDTFYENYSNEIVDYYNVEKDNIEVKDNTNTDTIIKNDNKQNKDQTNNQNKNDNVNNKQETNEPKKTETNKQEINNVGSNETQTVTPKDESKQEELKLNEPKQEEPKQDKPIIVNDNSVDENNMDYPTHKGRIDCYDVDSCVNISIPIQVKYKKSISNAFYVEVIAKNNNTLGYFIQYIFVDYNYGSYDKCSSIGEDMKQTLSNKVIGYDCSSDGILKVKTNY